MFFIKKKVIALELREQYSEPNSANYLWKYGYAFMSVEKILAISQFSDPIHDTNAHIRWFYSPLS